MRRAVSSSIRWHILGMVIGGAIIPLSLVGLWVTTNAVRSGKALLRVHLESAAAGFASAVETRWSHRRGEILFLAGNASAQRVVSGQRLSAVDSQYLTGLASQLAPVIMEFSYYGARGESRWSSTSAIVDISALTASPNAVRPPTVATTLPVRDAAGTPVGSMEARLAVSGLVGRDSLRIPVPGAVLAMRDMRTRTLLSPLPAPLAGDTGEVTVEGASWIAMRRSIREPQLELLVAAPIDAYVAPFASTARTGFTAVVLIGLAAAMLSVLVTIRITSRLERIAEASAAVARGDLERLVAVEGPTEIRTLAESFNTMTASLRRTMQELAHRSALAAVGEFAASLAHEVRNGLTAIKLDIQRAEEQLADGSRPRELVSRSLVEVMRLNATVTGALQVARGGQMPLGSVDLGAVLQQAVDRTRGTFAAAVASVHLTTSGEDELVVSGDADALGQLFVNVLLNASQAIGPGGATHVTGFRQNGQCVVVVADSGSGMSPEQVARATEPFFTATPGGTGLGLAIARQIVEAHGGALRIESEVGKGTTVVVSLPPT